MRALSRNSIAAVIGFAALVAGGEAESAGGFDRSLTGAWTASPQDCAKLFVRQGGALAYRQPVDKFAQAAIIEPGRIVTPASVCQVRGVTRAKGETKVSAECRDSISFTQATAYIKLGADGQMVYSPTGDPSLATTLTRCRL